MRRLIIPLIFFLFAVTFAKDKEKCPDLDQKNIRCVWEAINADDIRYFCMDLSSLDNGHLAIGFWRDTSYVSVFRITQFQVTSGSMMLLFESTDRNSTDKVVISGKGRACDSTGTIHADVQMVLKNSIFSQSANLILRKIAKGAPTTLMLLERVAEACKKKMKSGKEK
jgi:hypothetical protein